MEEIIQGWTIFLNTECLTTIYGLYYSQMMRFLLLISKTPYNSITKIHCNSEKVQHRSMNRKNTMDHAKDHGHKQKTRQMQTGSCRQIHLLSVCPAFFIASLHFVLSRASPSDRASFDIFSLTQSLHLVLIALGVADLVPLVLMIRCCLWFFFERGDTI